MSFHDSKLSQFKTKLNKIGNFRNSRNFSSRIQKFPGIPAGNFWDDGFPGIRGNSRTGIPGGPGLVERL